TLDDVAAVTGGRRADHRGAQQHAVDGPVVTDSHDVVPGALFVAFAGEHVDGHRFVAAALAGGAAAALVTDAEQVLAAGADPGRVVVVDDVAAALGDLARHHLAALRAARTTGNLLRVIAITGSYGKTTTKDLLGHLLASLGEVVAPPGSFNNEIGLPLTVLRATPDTQYLVLEMGADRVGNLTYLTSIAPPDIAVVLAVGRAHLGEFGGIENVARAKSELVAGLLPGGTAVLNADDARVAAMATLARGPVVTFGREPDADVRATDLALDGAGRARFTLVGAAALHEVRLALVGEHQVANALAAAVVALECGIGIEGVAAGLGQAGATSPHRMAVTDRDDGVRVVDDAYNANPDSMRAGLRALVTLAGPRRRIAVLGEMLELGADSAAEHAAVGTEAATLGIDVLLTVGPGTGPLADAARRAGTTTEVVEVADLAAAERHLAGLRPGDVVLLKGSHGTDLWRLAERLAGRNP
ncbi:MAG: UDP-N-acetylmuramoyl-tripeptide--D-alanyl-D-alanine ligase, partial [Georgenia sp.]